MNWLAGVGAGCGFDHGGGMDLMVFTEAREHLSSSFFDVIIRTLIWEPYPLQCMQGM